MAAEVNAKADEISLRSAYGVFKTEVLSVFADYQPITICTDGWMATQNALKYLFEKAKIVECYLHAYIKVRDRATKKLNDYYRQQQTKFGISIELNPNGK